MRFCSVRSGPIANVGVLGENGEIRLLSSRATDLVSLMPALMESARPALDDEPVSAAELAPPLHPGKIVAVGLNYRDHADESQVEAPERPLLFAKFPSSVTGPTDPIVVDPELFERADWEVELAVVVGRRMDRVPASETLDHVLGYTVANDVSARDVQFSDGQWTRGKSFNSFCPLGPCVVTVDELGAAGDLRLTTKVNGEIVQDDTTRSMIFDVPSLLEFCSHNFTLDPGDVVVTGTPSGCGEFMDPPRFLRPGDVVECSIEGIGTLTNSVVSATHASS
ncbi:fumarylacetoacetate hydrolase family protein [Thermoleophilia bacterium SCSIO 60948]|nr:fumarylacetoacetate hydrolase family protein [Thermoleophilia bacterium SCSIO 60948]